LYIARYLALAVLLLLLLALAPAMAQNVVYQGETSTLSVEQKPGDTYEWELYDDGTVNFATTPGNCPVTSAIFVGGKTGASVQVQWLKPKKYYFFKVTARDANGCTNNIKIGMMEVLPALPTAVIEPHTPICEGDWAELKVTLTGSGPWELTITDGVTSRKITGINSNPYLLKVKPSAPSWYWISEVKDQMGTNSKPSEKVWMEVYPRPDIEKIYPVEP